MTQTANNQIARAAGTVAFAIVFGQMMGLLRGILVARAFPVAELDAFYAANRVSETLFTLIAAGALGSAFLPTFTGFLVKDDKDSAWRLFYSLGNLVTLTLSLLAALAAVFAPQIVRYALTPGLSADPALFSLTIDLLRIQLISSVLFGLGGLIVGVLNAHQIFFIPQLTAAMYQIGQIFGVLVLSRWLGIYGLAWGVVIGAGLYLAIQVPTLRRLMEKEERKKKKEIFQLSSFFGFNNPAVRQVISLMGPRVLGAGVVQLNFWVNISLASQMSEGSITSLTYGFALMLMAQAAIAQSVAIAAMPTFSAQFALGKVDEMRHSLASAIRGMLLFAIPASVGLVMLAHPIVAMLYQRGKFDETAVQMTAWALAWYAAGMIGHSVLEVLTRAFYAQQDTKTPVLVGAGAMTLNVVFSFAFSAWFRHLGWMPHGGLALANSLATALEATLLFILMRQRLGGINGAEIASGVGKVSVAALGMALGLMAWMQLTGFVASAQPGGRLNPWAIGLGGVVVGGVVYGLGVVLLKVPEIEGLLGAIRRRIGR
jgi:putative peptidoglycan lipid II flippase